MVQVVGKIPEFTEDAPVSNEEGQPVEAEEKETPSTPEEKPVSNDEGSGEDEGNEKAKAIEKLQRERSELIKEIKELRGSKRELKQEQLKETNQHIDELKDLHPDDIGTIERVLRSKGYMTKDEAGKMFYEAVKNEELEKFLNKYPEYKPDNDPDNIRWGAFERQIEKEKELGYSLPKNPHNLLVFLERVHQALTPKSTTGQAAAERRIQIAGVGSRGGQQSSSPKRLDSDKRQILVRGGWTEEDIQNIEAKLPE